MIIINFIKRIRLLENGFKQNTGLANRKRKKPSGFSCGTILINKAAL
jgi:hypothetical protein